MEFEFPLRLQGSEHTNDRVDSFLLAVACSVGEVEKGVTARAEIPTPYTTAGAVVLPHKSGKSPPIAVCNKIILARFPANYRALPLEFHHLAGFP